MTINSEEFLDHIYRAWKEFIDSGRIISPLVRPEIADSWRRCVRNGVDPYGGVCNNILRGQELEELLYENRELIEVSRPFLYKLYKFLKGSGFMVMLNNAEGRILEFFGDRDMEEEASRINFMIGASWKEEDVGSTTMGVILHIKRPIQLTGAEHFCKKSHEWTCSAAPVVNEQGEMLGIFNVSGPCREYHKHTLGMVVAAVESIQHELTIRRKNHELQLITERMVNVFTAVSEAVIIVDRDDIIEQINPAAEEILGKTFAEGKALDELVLGNEFARKKMFSSYKTYSEIEAIIETETGRIECIVTGVPLKDACGNINGTVIVIRPMQKVHNLVKRFGNGQASFQFSDIIAKSPKMLEVIKISANASESDGTILLQGESGTGKEVFAQSIHNRSYRRKGPFIALNCGAIPRDLVGSELFGYVEGAFTGAKRGGRPGKFELASHGTIFLDEIGDMPLEQQVSLLRVLQERKIIRIGGDEDIPVDVRVICATNKDLLKEVEKGNFRQDLFYRLNVIAIKIPPLRERPEDIELLFKHYVYTMGKRCGYNHKDIDSAVFEYLIKYHWPGNVRELQNVAERMISISDLPVLSPEDLPEEIKNPDINHFTQLTADGVKTRIGEVRQKSKRMHAQEERKLLEEMLVRYNGNVARVARELGLSRTTIYRKMRNYDIER